MFLIGDGKTPRGAVRRYLIPPGATSLYLGVMDGYEWNTNSGSFTVQVAIERDQVDSAPFSVDSSVTFARWACLPDRARCTPDRPVAKEKAPGEFHVILPASSEWSISVPDAAGKAVIQGSEGTVCLRSDACAGPQRTGGAAGAGFLAEDRPAGALIPRVVEGRPYFSVNQRKGAPFRHHEGFFDFDVRTR